MVKCNANRILLGDVRLPYCLHDATHVVTVRVEDVRIEIPVCDPCAHSFTQPALDTTTRVIPPGFFY